MSLYSSDTEVLSQAITWLNAGYQVALVTVAKTWGASPRPCGSLLVMREDGLHVGSVSGGCIEEDLVVRYQNKELSSDFPTRIDYGVNREDALRFGLPCGGRLELIVEELESAAPLNLMLNKIAKNELLERRVCLNTGEVSLHAASYRPELSHRGFMYSDDEMIKVFGPQWHILLIGAGQLSRYVAELALMLDYRVTVCDPREQYQRVWDLPGVDFLEGMPDDAVTQLTPQQRCLVIALTHDPKLDDMALMQALTMELFYVGALGSRRNTEQRLQRLLQLGVSAEQLEHLHAPVGFPIGSHTPAEIALSIMAEITSLKNRAIASGIVDNISKVQTA